MPTSRVWAGWHKAPGGCWRRLCEGNDFGQVWDLLLGRIVTLGGGESIVLRSGRHPDQTSAASAERRRTQK